MDSWWLATTSTLAGAVTAALLQAWRESVVYHRQFRTRWDEDLLAGLVDYLATADRVVRSMLRWRHARDQAPSEMEETAAEALKTFEHLHEKSQVITLLTGPRNDSVRAEARAMREPLLILRDEIVGGARLEQRVVDDLVARHRDARTSLINAAQRRLGVPVG